MSASREDLRKQWEKASKGIEGYHIHIYFGADESSRTAAQDMAGKIQTLFAPEITSMDSIGAIGPHLSPNIAIHIRKDGFSKIVPWLQFNNGANLSILVHPETGDDLKDHLEGSMWLGKQPEYNMAFFDKLKQPKKEGPAPGPG